VTVTLIAPRPIVVMVTGNVVYPGLYTLSSVDRAHRAIEQANTPARAEMRVNTKRIMADMSTRNVVLKRKDSRIFRVDIEKFLATRKDRWNPFLREGDVVIVPRKDESRNIVAIYGEVNRPGRYEFVQGDSLRDLLDIVNGFARHARTDSVEFYRFDENGTSMHHWTVNAGAIVKGEASDLPLQPGDRVIVGSVPDLRKDYRATIVGEVLYPGTYPITRNSTRLSELVRRAGGVTASAALKSSYISRFHIPPRGGTVDTLLGERGRDETADLNYYAVDNILMLKQEFVSVDFSRLFGAGDTTQDVILQSEDTVFIAANQNTVYVYGQVRAPGHVEFMPGKDVDYYVKKVGGYLDQARTGEVKVIKGGSRQWISPGDTQIDEGDMIWVPKALERPFGYYLGIVAQAASILSVALSIVILSIQSRK
jgi:protein involved in polysaccharide export with SLBB domain